MKSSRFTEEQIIRAIKEVDAGRKVSDVCREWASRTRPCTTGVASTAAWK